MTSKSIEHDPDLAAYLVRSRAEILPLLAELVERRAPLEVKLEGILEPFMTRLVSVKPQYEELLFDAALLKDAASLDGSRTLEARTTLDPVQIVFNAAFLEPGSFGAQPVIRGRLPEVIARIQRRSSARLSAPSQNAPLCTGRFANGGERLHSLRVVNISPGGMALILDDALLDPDVGAAIPACRLELPGTGSLECDLVVTYVGCADANGWRRMGCRFDGLPILALNQIRRYLSKLERSP